jgi:acetyl-CoA synthase
MEDPDFYQPEVEDPDLENGKLWLGAADDKIMRKRGVEFVDGTAPGFAAIVGSAPDARTAKKMAEEYQLKTIYVFMCANQNGTTFAQQLVKETFRSDGTRLVPSVRIFQQLFSPWFATGPAWPSVVFSRGCSSSSTRRTAYSPL